MTTRPDVLQLRTMIHELINEALPELAAAVNGTATERNQSTETRTVRLTTDADVTALVATIIGLLDDPVQSRRLRNGSIEFRVPKGSAGRTAEPAAREAGDALRVDRGAVTEKVVTAAAATNSPVVMSTRAVLTPLGREKARKLGVKIVKET